MVEMDLAMEDKASMKVNIPLWEQTTTLRFKVSTIMDLLHLFEMCSVFYV